jgi:predicted ATP-grasp superfamily ATP-dependent carboligase
VKNKTLIIAAVSATGYAQAAANLGFDVITFDAFADADTSLIAKITFKLNLIEHSIDIDDFKQQFLTLNHEDFVGFLYGSLFDNAPDLLAWIASKMPVLGNTPQVLKSVKGLEFFQLLQSMNILHPEIKQLSDDEIQVLAHPEQWLVKRLSGTGGLHVKVATCKDNRGDYLQKKIEGMPISLLFVAGGKHAQAVGVNQQFVSPTKDLPYRFAGAVGHIEVAEKIKLYLTDVAEQLTTALGLRGCNSLDGVFDGERVWILELNPRLSATFSLYPNLMHAHLQGCAGELVELPQNDGSLAQLILYANQSLQLPVNFTWPEYVMNVPEADKSASYISVLQDEPVCTVLAASETAIAAKQLVYEKALTLEKRLLEVNG